MKLYVFDEDTANLIPPNLRAKSLFTLYLQDDKTEETIIVKSELSPKEIIHIFSEGMNQIVADLIGDFSLLKHFR